MVALRVVLVVWDDGRCADVTGGSCVFSRDDFPLKISSFPLFLKRCNGHMDGHTDRQIYRRADGDPFLEIRECI